MACESSDEYLKRFWELEEIPNADLRTVEERRCERHYDSTCTRDKTGRYIVRLPLKNDRETLGESRKMALKRFFSLEQRFKKNPTLKQEYVNFMQEDIKLGHMKEVNEKPKRKVYYLPHHAVIKEDSTTTKLRVMFDASAKTTSGQSLNSIMMTPAHDSLNFTETNSETATTKADSDIQDMLPLGNLVRNKEVVPTNSTVGDPRTRRQWLAARQSKSTVLAILLAYLTLGTTLSTSANNHTSPSTYDVAWSCT
ncbi:uncharacterized protein LOC119686342 [Teleopsis dalmanni]|uniref:uncharacterized protein LOC119686342 n=1 Tax=Teleopsis dalmanni TaxID=139649 RepID=UPI0018CCFFB3|nr:uncharacterized protein LOC119686342 [Teleopsis dalmanni]